MSHPIDEILRAQKRGEARGIPSICSAHPWVLKTALCGGYPVLIESTCNQVNQFGGYTGMTPKDFVAYVRGIAEENNYPFENIILGGDHLGPSVWQNEPAESAMHKAEGMIHDYVQAGFTKIHLDCSMKLADDPAGALDVEVIAKRAARLAKVAETTDYHSTPRYVVGTEVPIPGGETDHKEGVSVTKVDDARRTLEVMHAAFVEAGLKPAWEHVVALVVQPGVEFGDDFILDYDPQGARDLARFAETTPFVYEAHSTDYQTRDSLRNLVRDHFAILKVGPALTYAFREAVFALAAIEADLVAEEQRSRLVETLEAAMLRDPRHWRKHYAGTPEEQAYKRLYSRSDRVRYYWSDPNVQAAISKLLKNLDAVPLPLSLIGQFLPDMYPHIPAGYLPNSVANFIVGWIKHRLEDYSFASGNADP